MKTILFLLLLSSGVYCQDFTVNIISYGAKGDGIVNNAAAIQAAIDAVHVNGGGIVWIPAGNFVTGVLFLKSGVNLHLEKGAVLTGSSQRLNYGNGDASSLIRADGQSGISITGEGTINGNGTAIVSNLLEQLKAGVLKDAQWKIKRPAENNLPKIIEFSGCNHISIKGISLINSATWVQQYLRCTDLVIDSITVNSITNWNNDGLDITDSKNVVVTRCNINASDDAICLKSEGTVLDSCVNVYIADCKLRSSANAFKLGTASRGGFRNIRVRNLKIYDTYRSAIALEAVDGGFLENVDIQNVKATNTGSAILIRLGHRNKDTQYSVVRHIHIADVKVEVPAGKPDHGYTMEGPLLKYPPGFKPDTNKIQSVSPWNNSGYDSTAIPYLHNVFPSSITGLPGHPVQDIVLENIEITYAGGASKAVNYFPLDSLAVITEAPMAYPEFSMFGELPVWGLYVRHAAGLVMKNIRLSYQTTDFRAAMVFDDIHVLKLNTVEIPTAEELPVIVLKDVKNSSIKKVKLAKGYGNTISTNARNF